MSVEKFRVTRVPLFAMALTLSTALSQLVHASPTRIADAVHSERAADGFPWSLIMLLVALTLTAFIGRGQNRGEN